MQRRLGKSIGYADGPSRIPNLNQVTTSPREGKLGEPVETKSFQPIHKSCNLFESKGSLGHCFLSDLRMSAEKARSFKRKFPYNFPESINSPIFVQQTEDRFIYLLVTKKRFYQKPTYDSLR